MNMEKQMKTYQVRDLGESGALLTNGNKLVDIRKEGNVCWFVFEDFDECERLSKLFWFGEFKVNAKDYYDSITKLKSRIFQT